MQLPGAMEGTHALDELAQRGAKARARAQDVREKIGAAHELHREEGAIVCRRPELAEMHQVGVVDVGERAKLLLEEGERRGGEVAERLQGHDAVVRVERLVDDPHPAAADRPQNLVARLPRAGGPAPPSVAARV